MAVAFVVLAVVGLEAVQRFVPWSARKDHNDVAGFIYAVLGVVYAVLLAFATIAVWEDFEAARETVDLEANELAELYWLAREMPEPEGSRLRELTISYARVVVEEEWPLMNRGTHSPRAEARVARMRSTVGGYQPSDDARLVIYDKALDAVRETAEQRRLRLFEAEERMPRLLWWVLISGGAIAVGFTYLFGLQNTRSHRLMIASLASIIALSLFTMYALDQPFHGITRVQPNAFEQVLDQLTAAERDR